MNPDYSSASQHQRDEARRRQQVQSTMSPPKDDFSPSSSHGRGRVAQSSRSLSSSSSSRGRRIATPPPSTPSEDMNTSHEEEQALEWREVALRPNSPSLLISLAQDHREINAPLGPRKGHKKSRQGCYNCKRRKIKCQETQPECENCTRKKIKCTYPAQHKLAALQLSSMYSASPSTSINSHGTPTAFSLTDMRLFHHFLMNSYPYIPVGNDVAWTNQVPLIAHHNQYLMHAILGMAASHLELTTGEDLNTVAINHRFLAIKGSNQAISQKRRSGHDGDALLGACYALTFQASYMKDGLMEYFQMVRGCELLQNQLRLEKLPLAFLLEEKHIINFLKQNMQGLPIIEAHLTEAAYRSLHVLPAILEGPGHLKVHGLLLGIIDSTKYSSLKEAYVQFLQLYLIFSKMQGHQLAEIINPANHAWCCLLAHFLAIHFLLGPIINRQWVGREKSVPLLSRVYWIFQLYDNAPEGMKAYFEWPRATAEGYQRRRGLVMSPSPSSFSMMESPRYLEGGT